LRHTAPQILGVRSGVDSGVGIRGPRIRGSGRGSEFGVLEFGGPGRGSRIRGSRIRGSRIRGSRIRGSDSGVPDSGVPDSGVGFGGRIRGSKKCQKSEKSDIPGIRQKTCCGRRFPGGTPKSDFFDFFWVFWEEGQNLIPGPKSSVKKTLFFQNTLFDFFGHFFFGRFKFWVFFGFFLKS